MNTKQNNQSNIIAIITMIFLFGMIAFVTNLAAPMGVVLKDQFGASNFEGMLGNAMNFIAYAMMGIPGGILLQRLGYKKTAIIATIVGFVGIGIQYLAGHAGQNMAFSIYLLGALVAGFSMTLLNTVVNPMLNTLGGGGNKGNQLIQVGGTFNSVMATLTPAFIGILIGGGVASAKIADVFPVLYIAMGVFAFASVALVALKIPEPKTEKSSESIGKLMSGALKFRHFILGGIAIGIYVGVEIGVPATMNLWLSDSPIGKTTAGSVAGTYWFLMLIGRLIGASVGSKVSSKTMLSVASILGLIFVSLAIFIPVSDNNMVNLPVLQRNVVSGSLSFGMAEVYINAMFLVLIGLCTSIMWGGIFNLAVEGLGKYLTAASGIFMTMVVGGGLIPALQGWIADISGYLVSYWIIFACLAYLLFYALVGCKNVNKDIPVD